jgi:hypothetical protein
MLEFNLSSREINRKSALPQSLRFKTASKVTSSTSQVPGNGSTEDKTAGTQQGASAVPIIVDPVVAKVQTRNNGPIRTMVPKLDTTQTQSQTVPQQQQQHQQEMTGMQRYYANLRGDIASGNTNGGSSGSSGNASARGVDRGNIPNAKMLTKQTDNLLVMLSRTAGDRELNMKDTRRSDNLSFQGAISGTKLVNPQQTELAPATLNLHVTMNISPRLLAERERKLEDRNSPTEDNEMKGTFPDDEGSIVSENSVTSAEKMVFKQPSIIHEVGPPVLTTMFFSNMNNKNKNGTGTKTKKSVSGFASPTNDKLPVLKASKIIAESAAPFSDEKCNNTKSTRWVSMAPLFELDERGEDSPMSKVTITDSIATNTPGKTPGKVSPMKGERELIVIPKAVKRTEVAYKKLTRPKTSGSSFKPGVNRQRVASATHLVSASQAKRRPSTASETTPSASAEDHLAKELEMSDSSSQVESSRAQQRPESPNFGVTVMKLNKNNKIDRAIAERASKRGDGEGKIIRGSNVLRQNQSAVRPTDVLVDHHDNDFRRRLSTELDVTDAETDAETEKEGLTQQLAIDLSLVLEKYRVSMEKEYTDAPVRSMSKIHLQRLAIPRFYVDNARDTLDGPETQREIIERQLEELAEQRQNKTKESEIDKLLAKGVQSDATRASNSHHISTVGLLDSNSVIYDCKEQLDRYQGLLQRQRDKEDTQLAEHIVEEYEREKRLAEDWITAMKQAQQQQVWANNSPLRAARHVVSGEPEDSLYSADNEYVKANSNPVKEEDKAIAHTTTGLQPLYTDSMEEFAGFYDDETKVTSLLLNQPIADISQEFVTMSTYRLGADGMNNNLNDSLAGSLVLSAMADKTKLYFDTPKFSGRKLSSNNGIETLRARDGDKGRRRVNLAKVNNPRMSWTYGAKENECVQPLTTLLEATSVSIVPSDLLQAPSLIGPSPRSSSFLAPQPRKTK